MKYLRTSFADGTFQMPAGKVPCGLARHRQRGITLMLILVMITLLVGTFAVAILSPFGAKLRGDRATEDALARAKEALISYAVSDANRPGELPCPDTNNNGQIDIGIDTSGSNCTALVGRLPWAGLGLTDLRDGSGERLWYALSNDFHANGTTPLNSDTPGQLTITGVTPEPNPVVAVIFAPGPPLETQGQNRTTANANTVSHYLEGTNATSTTNFETANASQSFNDRMITIKPAEIFRLVEKRVARELRTPGLYLEKYFADWGRYPFAAPVADTSIPTNFVGTSGTYEGLLPVARNMNPVVWNSSASFLSGSLVPFGCNVSSAPNTMQCRGFALAVLGIGSNIRVDAYARNVGGAFVDPITTASVSTDPPLNNLTIVSQTLDATGQAHIVITGQTSQLLFLATQYVFINRPQLSSWVNSSWITQNDWPRVSYYAVAAGMAPDGIGSCNEATNACGSPPTPPGTNACLSICNAESGTANNGAEALVVMTGPALRPPFMNQTRGSSYNVSDYLEDGNVSTSDNLFENKIGAPTFNDQTFALVP